MLEKFVTFILEQLANMGIGGLIIACLLIAVYKLWQALLLERQRSDNLTDKLYDLSKETALMLERITGR